MMYRITSILTGCWQMNPITSQGPWQHFLRILILITIPNVLLVGVSIFYLNASTAARTEIATVRYIVTYSEDIQLFPHGIGK